MFLFSLSCLSPASVQCVEGVGLTLYRDNIIEMMMMIMSQMVMSDGGDSRK